MARSSSLPDRDFCDPTASKPSACPEGQARANACDFVWTTAGALAADIDAWRDLADNAIEPNPVYGANFLVAAEKHLRRGQPIRLLVGRDRETGRLLALAPIQDRGWGADFGGRAFELFVNPYVTLTHPLIRRENAAATLAAMLDFLGQAGGEKATLHFPYLTERRSFHVALSDVARRRGLALVRVDGFSRASVEPEPGKGGANYAQSYVSKSRRSNNDRRLRRLREIGAVEFRNVFVDKPGGPEVLDAFLEIERASWKGEAGTALLCRDETRDFARDAFSGRGHSPCARIRSLMLDGRAIAMALDLESQGVAYAFKAAYDDAFAHFSPGLMLDAHTASRIGEDFEIKRLDSFAQTEVAQAAVWRQEEAVARYVLSLSASGRRAESAARRLRMTTALRNHAKRYVRRGLDVATHGVRRLGGEKRAVVALMLLAALPVVSIFLKNLL